MNLVKQTFLHLILLLLLAFSHLSFAALLPPYIAFSMGEGLTFDAESCLEAVNAALKEDGFERVSKSGSTDVLAAFKTTKDYQFKALVTCLPTYGMIRVVIVTNFSGKGTDKANRLLRSIEKYLTEKKQPPATKNSQEVSADTAVVTAPKERKESLTVTGGEKEYQLGNMYYEGNKVPRDFAEAVKWYREAGERGHAEAQYKLGAMYFQGQNVTQNLIEAYAWLLLATAQGKKEAFTLRDKVEATLSSSQVTEGQQLARQLYEKYSK